MFDFVFDETVPIGTEYEFFTTHNGRCVKKLGVDPRTHKYYLIRVPHLSSEFVARRNDEFTRRCVVSKAEMNNILSKVKSAGWTRL